MDAELIGQEAYSKIIMRNYKEAILILNKGIHDYPNDFRFVSNRCYCHLELGEFSSAKSDALNLKLKFPENWHGYLLMGEVFMEEKKYADAEKEFCRALEFQHNDRIADRLFEVQMEQILDNPTLPDPIKARIALLQTKNVERALYSLALNIPSNGSWVEGPAISFSPNGEKHLISELRKAGIKVTHTKALATGCNDVLDPFKDPKNPRKIKTIWIGNLTRQVNKESLLKLINTVSMGRFEISKVSEGNNNRYAFVKFSDYSDASRAMKKLQNYLYEGKKLIIRYPDSDFNTSQ